MTHYLGVPSLKICCVADTTEIVLYILINKKLKYIYIYEISMLQLGLRVYHLIIVCNLLRVYSQVKLGQMEPNVTNLVINMK